MKVAKLAIGAVLVGGLLVGVARAQSPGEQPPADPAYGFAQAQDTAASPSDAPGVASAASKAPSDSGNAPGEASATSNWPHDRGEGYGSCPSGAGADEPFRIFGKHDSGIEAGGWVSVGGHANQFGETWNGPLGFNTVGDGVNVHQLWGYVAKETETQGLGTDWGARVDYVFGIDGPDTQAIRGTGWDLDWNTGRDYGSAIPQAYAEIAVNYLTVKAGYFFTPLGYERVQAPENFFYSHSYTHYYVEPFTHTGALATYDGIEDWTFYGGWTAGWDTAWEKIGGSNMFLGGATYHLGDDLAVTYMTSAGQLDSLATGRGDVYMHSIVMELGLTERLDWIIQSDLHYRNGAERELTAGGVNQYLLWTLNECWAFGFRFEWLYDRDGAFVAPGRAAGNFYNLTAGVNWKPHANVIFRPEVRYDWFSGTYAPGGLPFDAGRENEQFSGGFDLIFLF